eukprot:CAMPEP_0206531208 /NCGR_PEP_ID=MMETSP0325_2-20121206/3630_1 /ASSEMBLY_ACC=CAM_ASM_000347 /TAXON_ID=2866 /ORGANISM="Crypthecodinium cohnii, Strain Seligo" /LENGTH=66 /DNA_ID=CAMNT_0054027411 /DNA_START=153 /DNA_END=349 /DNA_ORIENTATION=+
MSARPSVDGWQAPTKTSALRGEEGQSTDEDVRRQNLMCGYKGEIGEPKCVPTSRGMQVITDQPSKG